MFTQGLHLDQSWAQVIMWVGLGEPSCEWLLSCQRNELSTSLPSCICLGADAFLIALASACFLFHCYSFFHWKITGSNSWIFTNHWAQYFAAFLYLLGCRRFSACSRFCLLSFPLLFFFFTERLQAATHGYLQTTGTTINWLLLPYFTFFFFQTQYFHNEAFKVAQAYKLQKPISS